MNDAPTKDEFAALSDILAVVGAIGGLVFEVRVSILSDDSVMVSP